MLYIALLLLALWLFYKKWTSIYSYWEKRGFPFLPGVFPYGYSMGLAIGTKFAGEVQDEIYKDMGSHPFIGVYDVRLPTIMLKDPDLIRVVLTKEFSHFRDRFGFPVPKEDQLAQHLFMLDGDKWRALRVKMSPTFTSGRMKGMFPLFVQCAENFNKLLLSKIESSIDVKDVFSRYSMDVICTCAFGIEVDGYNSDTEFRRVGITAFQVRAEQIIMGTIFKVWPSLLVFVQKFNKRMTPKDTEDFIVGVVRENIEIREKNGIKRNDFIDLLMQLRDKKLKVDDLEGEEEQDKASQPIEMTLGLMAAQCFVFFIAGYETSSSVLTYCLYELALHQEIQERLHDEIEKVIAKHGGITYQALQEMEYLDMVVSETLRKYPTLIFLMRRCNKDFSMPDGTTFLKGDRFIVPVWSLHHDPEYFPNPYKFDPERFSSENLPNIKPYTYLPFGEGPRMCIGMRFGQVQTKVGLITILRKYRVEPNEKTPSSLSYKGNSFLTMTKEKIYLKLLKRFS